MKKIALIAGKGRLPVIFAQEARKDGAKVIAMAIEGLTEEGLVPHVDKMYWGSITEVKRALEILKAEKINYIVMTGKIPKSVIFNKNINFDKEGASVLKNTINSRDYTIFKAIAGRLRKEGIRVLDATVYLSNLLASKGLLAEREPTKEEWEDIRFGYKAAKALAGMDIGQAVAIKKKSILAVEALEGTDMTIRRAGEIGGKGVVIVKVSKPRHDMRFDIPTVGPDTLDSLIAAKASVLAIEAKKTLVVDKEEIAKKAGVAGIAVVAV